MKGLKITARIITFGTILSGMMYYQNISEPNCFSANAEGVYICSEVTYDNLTFEKYFDHAELIKCDPLAEEISVPEEIDGVPVTIIGQYAFSNCINLKSVNIPEGVKVIGASAFEWCEGLTEITVPNSVILVGDRAFSFCLALESIKIMNPNCKIYDSASTIHDRYFKEENDWKYDYTGMIYVFENSTAQSYAEKYGYKFEIINEDFNTNGEPDISDIISDQYGSNLQSTEEPAETSETVQLIKGDVNFDGNVDITDVITVAAFANNPESNKLSEEAIKAGDVHNTGDGLTANDALKIQQYLSGVITEF